MNDLSLSRLIGPFLAKSEQPFLIATNMFLRTNLALCTNIICFYYWHTYPQKFVLAYHQSRGTLLLYRNNAQHATQSMAALLGWH